MEIVCVTSVCVKSTESNSLDSMYMLLLLNAPATSNNTDTVE